MRVLANVDQRYQQVMGWVSSVNVPAKRVASVRIPVIKISLRKGLPRGALKVSRDKLSFLCFTYGKKGHMIQNCHTHRRLLLRSPQLKERQPGEVLSQSHV